MTSRPILFSAPMIRALLDGRKTQTRRIVKPQPEWVQTDKLGSVATIGRSTGMAEVLCPYGQPGDLLWVREAWQYANWTDDGLPFIGYRASGVTMLCDAFPESWTERLIDIWAELSEEGNFQIDSRAADRHWRPSIYMPRWASRLTLRITDVRIERLQEISEEDARAEGVDAVSMDNVPRQATCSRRQDFAQLWDILNAKRGHSWASNPWIWALTFDVIMANVDEVKP